MPPTSPLDHARRLLADSRKLVVFTGAGVSADSGVPTFRGSPTGQSFWEPPTGQSFWEQYDPQQLATPQGFHANPQLVYDWYTYRRSQLTSIHPNPAHQAIARWQQSKNAIVITQNIDGLHERIAPPHATILRLHGSLAEDRCSVCDHLETLDFQHLPKLRRCPHCNNWLRPNVVWFGEPLDEEIWSAAEDAMAAADVVLSIGTSGEVWPAASLVHTAARHAHLIVVNLDPTSLDDLATVTFHARAAEIVPQLLSAP